MDSYTINYGKKLEDLANAKNSIEKAEQGYIIEINEKNKLKENLVNLTKKMNNTLEKLNNTDDENLQHFHMELSSNQPQCGKLTLAQARFLFGNVATEVKSCAIIPMVFTEMEGLIAIGSRDETRFHCTMGNLFLTQLSEVISTRLISLLD